MVCGLCVAECPKKALELGFSKPGLNFCDTIIHKPKKCNGCGLCADICPEGMIKMIKEKKE